MITAGEILRKKREALGRSLEVVSQETKIQKRFLQYIENNEFSRFDSEVFLTGFIKIYSKYLNLDTDKVLALYRRSKPIQSKKGKKKESNKKRINARIFLTSKSIITIISIIFFVLILGYIGIQIYKFQSPPTLTISSPSDGTTTTTSDITVNGTTQPGAVVEVNGTLITVDDKGDFQKDIQLNEGINIITVEARKNSSSVQETVQALKVTYTKPVPQVDTTTSETPKTFTLTVEVTGVAAWLKLDIDGENKLSQTVQPSKTDYDVKNTFDIMTGKVKNTNVYVNGDQLTWKTDSSTGVAEITCNIANQTLSCQ